jgi:hypothetical protein
MQLTDDQKAKVTTWVEEGCGLSEIQRRIASEFQVSLTYMDVRFLVLDLGLQVREKPGTEKKKEPAAPAAAHPAADDEGAPFLDNDTGGAEPGAPAASRVQVGVDRIMQPGTLVSGTVTFSDGVSGKWSLDQYGRMALDLGGQRNYRPSRPDLEAFQLQLQEQLTRRGM